MLRGTEKWVTYFVLVIVFIFGIVFLAKQIGVTTDLKHSLAQAKYAGIYSGDLHRITVLHNASAKIFFLSFFALCLLLIGIIIIMKGIERAYAIPEVKEKVHHHLRSTTPGVVLTVLAAFLLAFCTYRASHIETVYSSRLIDYNNYKVAMLGWDKKADTLRIDSTALQKLKTDVKKVASKLKKKGKSTTKKLAKGRHSKAAKKQHPDVAKNDKKSLKKNQQPSKTTKAKVVAIKYDKKENDQKEAIAIKQKTAPAKQETINKYHNKPVTHADFIWANQFQRNVTIYGYVPTKDEEDRYNHILDYYKKYDGDLMNNELNWAYSFLEKTKQGYEPKPGELRKYEQIIERNLRSSAVPKRTMEEL